MPSYIRKLYHWVLNWADTPYAPLALFILSFSEASFFPIPPDVLLIALALGNRINAFKFAFICSIGSVLGAMVGYGIGHYFWWNGENYTTVAQFFFNNIPGFNETIFHRIQTTYEQHGFIIIFTAGFTFIPFKVFTISAGAFNISFPLFIIASTLSRAARFFLVSFLIWKFDTEIRDFINYYFNLLTVLLIILLLSSYIIIKLLIAN